MAASFALSRAPAAGQLRGLGPGDQAIPRLQGGGLVRWLETGDQLHRLTAPLGVYRQHNFIYASSAPSFGQWLLAHGAGGRLVAGAVRLQDGHEQIGTLRMGEVIEVSSSSVSGVLTIVRRLCRQLHSDHLRAVSLDRLMRDAGVKV